MFLCGIQTFGKQFFQETVLAGMSNWVNFWFCPSVLTGFRGLRGRGRTRRVAPDRNRCFSRGVPGKPLGPCDC
ncbi:hypothetical protein CCP4SC76_2970002 [Gammaproteobacteria bacterium]